MLAISSVVLFFASVVLLGAFIVNQFFGVAIPYLFGFEQQRELVLLGAYALLLLSIAARSTGAGAPRAPLTLRTLGTVAAIIGVIVSVLAFLLEQQRSTQAATVQLLVDLDKSRPPNGRFCRCALLELNGAALQSIYKRESVPLGRRAEVLLEKCFLDTKQDEWQQFVAGGTLTPRGASRFAERINRILNADDDMALAVTSGVASREVVTKTMFDAFAMSGAVARKFEEEFGSQSFPFIKKYLERNTRWEQAADKACKGL